MGIMKEFKDFAMKGNMIDMAVGIVIGGAFGTIISSLVNDVIMPPIGMLTSGVDFAKWGITLQDAVAEVKDASGTVTTPAKAAVVIGIGKFINAFISFLIVAFALFMVVKAMNTAKKRFEQEEAAAPPPPPPAQEVLLGEIRDLLKKA